ncbi:BsuPI-related putative proteinase inhibitor [Aliikangiella sp. G2MR2-5]|uniref:BsuPI-related putative proteinase inhibitor n=1 Tax=Aliikangiella sp. G2MR2-5 TaxID=2788943 RepID=UPI0018ABCD60|nr:BsuPI-related putative proteinase inhibitor [Aliikangiella sp. G2MR2-5]
MNALKKTLVAGSLICSGVVAQASEYLPMSVNDHKVFKVNEREIVVEVTDFSGDNWKKYSNYMGRSEQWIWSSKDSQKIFWYNNEGGAQLLVDFNHAVGTEYLVDIDGCTNSARIEDKQYQAVTEAGTFDNSILLVFNGDCYDAGLASAAFAPGIGLVAYAQQSIIGPVTTEMVRAQVDGISYPLFDGIEVSSQFPSGRTLSNVQEYVSAYLTITNYSKEKEVFNFNTSQQFDIEIHDINGEVVNKWSADRRFMTALTSVEILPGASHKFGGQIKLVDVNGKALQVGSYTIRVELKGSNQPVSSAFEAIPFAAESPLYIDQKVSAFN